VFLKRKCLIPGGFTLIEVIVTIVVLSIAATAIMSVFTSTIRTSADPMIQQQALSIAEAYMEEIQLKPVSDPGGSGSRNDVLDYNGISDTVLTTYTVAVSVTADGLPAIPAVAPAVPAADALLIRISVSHAAIDPIVLHGYRTRYP